MLGNSVVLSFAWSSRLCPWRWILHHNLCQLQQRTRKWIPHKLLFLVKVQTLIHFIVRTPTQFSQNVTSPSSERQTDKQTCRDGETESGERESGVIHMLPCWPPSWDNELVQFSRPYWNESGHISTSSFCFVFCSAVSSFRHSISRHCTASNNAILLRSKLIVKLVSASSRYPKERREF